MCASHAHTHTYVCVCAGAHKSENYYYCVLCVFSVPVFTLHGTQHTYIFFDLSYVSWDTDGDKSGRCSRSFHSFPCILAAAATITLALWPFVQSLLPLPFSHITPHRSTHINLCGNFYFYFYWILSLGRPLRMSRTRARVTIFRGFTIVHYNIFLLPYEWRMNVW